MDKSRALYRVDLSSGEITRLVPRQSQTLEIKEKQIENWMATNRDLLFSEPDSVMVFAQEVSGEVMADMLAVDSQGGLIIVEIKRHNSDRHTVAQLLDYGARLSTWTYEDFNRKYHNHSKSSKDLFGEFKTFVENPDFDFDDFLRDRRLIILASSEDDSLKRIVAWLRDTYSVPIDFIPFQFYEDNGEVFLDMMKIEIEALSPRPDWSGDWFFNTNETFGKGAYTRMIDQHVMAVYGYPDSAGLLNKPATSDRIFAYTNNYGIIAVGRVAEGEAYASNSVFGKQSEQEFHRKVAWDAVVEPSKALKPQQSSLWGYNLPVRSTLCRMYAGETGDRIAQELKNRESQREGE